MTDGPTTPPPGGMPGAPVSLVERVKNILVTPKTEWPRIDAEPATIGGIYTGYVLILAAIGPIALLIGQQVFGYSAFGVTYKPPIATSVGSAVLTYILSLVSVYVSSLIIDALAPSFGGTKDQVKAFKVAAYSATAAWLAGIFNIIPMLAFLAIVGLYSLYLLFVGLPMLMRVPADKAVGYVVVVIIVQIVLYFVVAMIVGALVLAFFGGIGAMGGGTVVRY
jgi:hypothetical protein